MSQLNDEESIDDGLMFFGLINLGNHGIFTGFSQEFWLRLFGLVKMH